MDKFFIYLLLLSLGTITRTSIAFAISSVVRNRSIALVVYSMINLAMIVSDPLINVFMLVHNLLFV